MSYTTPAPEQLPADERFMRQALAQAQAAYRDGEVPIGAVVVARGAVIGAGHNAVESLADPTAHAEMLALSAACQALGAKYLDDCTMYVTVEPCPMCAGALYWAKIGRVVIGALDNRYGSSRFGHLYHPKTAVHAGVLASECSGLVRSFFAQLRG